LESQETERSPVRIALPKHVREVFAVLCHVGFFERSTLIGTWAMFFYRAIHHIPFALYTTDIDMAVQVAYPKKFLEADLEKVLQEIGAISDFSSDGLQRFIIPEFRIEFIAQNKGSRTKEPSIVPVPEWNINAQQLPFIRMLLDFTETMTIDDFYVRIPVPEAFFVHKLIIANRRRDSSKKAKDLDQCRTLSGILGDEKLQQVIKSEKFGPRTKKLIQRSCESIDFLFHRLGI
jgi:hypothetical protein